MTSEYKFTVNDLNAMMSAASGDKPVKPKIGTAMSKLKLKDKAGGRKPVDVQTPMQQPIVGE